MNKSPENPTPNERWEAGLDHDPRSKALYEVISKFDYEHNNDFFEFKAGGDGDNGEELMYLLDMFFYEYDREYARTKIEDFFMKFPTE